MPRQDDPEGIEPKNLFDIVDMADVQVLEIGCGDGRLTWRYAAAPKRVIATDPDPIRLKTALNDWPSDLRSDLAFVQIQAEALPFPNEAFELAILAWSL